MIVRVDVNASALFLLSKRKQVDPIGSLLIYIVLYA